MAAELSPGPALPGSRQCFVLLPLPLFPSGLAFVALPGVVVAGLVSGHAMGSR